MSIWVYPSDTRNCGSKELFKAKPRGMTDVISLVYTELAD